MTQPTFRDVELLSAYLDGQLPPADATRLEIRLKFDPQLRTVHADLTQSRAILRQLPARRAPRNFMLTPKMAGVKPPLPRSFPFLRLASALATLLLFFSFTANLTLPALSAVRSAAPMAVAFGKGGGGDETSAADAMPAAAPPALEAPAMAAPLAPTESIEAQRNLEPADASQAVFPPQVESAPSTQPVPLIVEIILLVLALAAGATATFLRWQVDRKFTQTMQEKQDHK